MNRWSHAPPTSPEVALVFPPLVEMNFGHYYPSTAVLGGYLAAQDTAVLQLDLNEDFALSLLTPAALARRAQGDCGEGLRLPPHAMPAVAARLLAREPHALRDEQGRHLFRDDTSPLAYLLKLMAQPYRLDWPLADLLDPRSYERPEARAYETFFTHMRLQEALPPSLRLVGLSLPMGPQLAPALMLARYLKRHRPKLAVVLGGPALSLLDTADIEALLAAHPAVDAVVRFDGERPLARLLAQRRAGSWAPATVPGVSARTAAGVVHCPPEAGLRLDELPDAAYDPQLLQRLAKPEIGIVQARGCYWGRCAYCDYVKLYEGSPPCRLRSPRSFVAEMARQLKQHGVAQFTVITEALPPAFAAQVSRLILAEGLAVRWHAFARVDGRFTSPAFREMARAGCEFLVVGAETLTDRVLTLLDKGTTGAETSRFLRRARAAGLDLKLNLIPDLPTTTAAEAQASLAACRGLADCVSLVSVFPFEATRSSRLGREPGRYGLVPGGAAAGQSQFSLNHLDVTDPAMTPAARAEVLAAYRDFAREVNHRHDLDGVSRDVPAEALDGTRFRLAEEYLDLTPLAEGLQCVHALTQERFQMPPECGPLIEKMRLHKIFRHADFLGWFTPPAAGEFYFHKFLEKGMLTVEEAAA